MEIGVYSTAVFFRHSLSGKNPALGLFDNLAFDSICSIGSSIALSIILFANKKERITTPRLKWSITFLGIGSIFIVYLATPVKFLREPPVQGLLITKVLAGLAVMGSTGACLALNPKVASLLNSNSRIIIGAGTLGIASTIALIASLKIGSSRETGW